MWPFHSKAQPVEPVPLPRPAPPSCWRGYELPAGRTWESFRYLVQEGYGDPDDEDDYIVTDEVVTDDDAERDRLVARMRDQGYEPRVVDPSRSRERRR